MKDAVAYVTRCLGITWRCSNSHGGARNHVARPIAPVLARVVIGRDQELLCNLRDRAVVVRAPRRDALDVEAEDRPARRARGRGGPAREQRAAAAADVEVIVERRRRAAVGRGLREVAPGRQGDACESQGRGGLRNAARGRRGGQGRGPSGAAASFQTRSMQMGQASSKAAAAGAAVVHHG